MPNLSCPLRLAALKSPHKTAIAGHINLSYQELDNYTDQLTLKFNSLKKQTVIVYTCIDPLFAIALLFSCLRNKQIFFPINPKLPNRFLEKRLNSLQKAHYISTSIPYKPHKIKGAPVSIDPSAPLTYLFTSGSSGDPKIAVHSYSQHYYSALGSNQHLDYQSSHCWLLSLPLYHVSGLSLIFRTLLAKASLALPISSIEDALEQKSITHLSLVPTQLQRLIKINSLKALHCILLGGGPISENLYKQATDLHLPLLRTYGLTEMSSQVVTDSLKTKQPTTLPFREIKLSTSNEILVRGKTLFMGYLANDTLLKPFDKENWFSTKDLGMYTKDSLYILGRKDNLFISGGENIQPEEIEQVLLKHPKISEALVIPKPDKEFGQRPVAFIKPLSPLIQIKLDAFLNSQLPKFKHPIEYYELHYEGLKPSRKKLLHFFEEINPTLI
ncbi:MAG: 2-succinylbenzoate--CoA ligase [Chlamydiae bacterium]|nr:2-succinylbenzoate--CoA ligase [Chlamydiota bacterium]